MDGWFIFRNWKTFLTISKLNVILRAGKMMGESGDQSVTSLHCPLFTDTQAKGGTTPDELPK